MTIEKVLVVDDELLMRDFLAETLRRKNLDVTTADAGKEATALLKDNVYDLVITDMKMPDISGIDVLKKVKEISPSTMVVIITAFGSIDNAVDAMRLGAFNYLLKPFSPDAIEAILEKANEHLGLIEENHFLRKQVSATKDEGFSLIAESPAMKNILHSIDRIASSNSSVFITGESGTGKEVIAHAIHFKSNRSNRAFIKVNCAAIPESLIESEFFGHEKGAFTGANSKRIGRFELANEGTLFLDEITETPLSFQSKLLRVTQEQEFERVGGCKPIKVDVRLVSTSNRDIKHAIAHNLLREDLFYRLNVVPIHLPPLRERREDIVPLCEHFLIKMCQENHKEPKKLSHAAKEKLTHYNWPGNVRELANIIERSIVMDISQEISPEHLYLEGTPPPAISAPKETETASEPIGEQLSLKEIEKLNILERLGEFKENRTRTAKSLGISLRTLRNKLKEYEIS